MAFTQVFIDAFNHAELYEVGPFWNPLDPDVIAGNCVTPLQARKVGFVNIPADRGGVTKYGIAQNANPTINVINLNLVGAQTAFYSKYWLLGKCDKIKSPISILHFDGCVNIGVGRSSKFLQVAIGLTGNDVDGQIGPFTLSTLNAADSTTVINNLSRQRIAFYNGLVSSNPSQQIFLAGWLRRVNEVTAFALARV